MSEAKAIAEAIKIVAEKASRPVIHRTITKGLPLGFTTVLLVGVGIYSYTCGIKAEQVRAAQQAKEGKSE